MATSRLFENELDVQMNLLWILQTWPEKNTQKIHILHSMKAKHICIWSGFWVIDSFEIWYAEVWSRAEVWGRA
jgi:hypothetical protein